MKRERGAPRFARTEPTATGGRWWLAPGPIETAREQMFTEINKHGRNSSY